MRDTFKAKGTPMSADELLMSAVAEMVSNDTDTVRLDVTLNNGDIQHMWLTTTDPSILEYYDA